MAMLNKDKCQISDLYNQQEYMVSVHIFFTSMNILPFSQMIDVIHIDIFTIYVLYDST